MKITPMLPLGIVKWSGLHINYTHCVHRLECETMWTREVHDHLLLVPYSFNVNIGSGTMRVSFVIWQATSTTRMITRDDVYMRYAMIVVTPNLGKEKIILCMQTPSMGKEILNMLGESKSCFTSDIQE